MKNKKKSLAEIPANVPMEGYIWFSDSEKPVVFFNETLSGRGLPTGNVNPFIVEGHLIDTDKTVSYSIRYDGSETYVYEYPIARLNEEYSELEFIPVRMGRRVEKIVFRQFWKEMPDPLCENLEVLKPSSIVFYGFKKVED